MRLSSPLQVGLRAEIAEGIRDHAMKPEERAVRANFPGVRKFLALCVKILRRLEIYPAMDASFRGFRRKQPLAWTLLMFF